jgi:subtilase family serine protease
MEMKIKNGFTLFIVFALVLVLFGAFPAAARSGLAPMLEKGPLASPANVVSPDNAAYGLFTCQIGASPFTCYDPYQMRRAYGADLLIAAGYNGAGKTIVIVDAFQNPNIVNALNTFISFYGLTPMNAGSGTPTFTQVAPDGLTAFDPNDDNMVGWASEITLDVLWAHAIAPGANIVLELSTDNSDAAILSAINDAVNNHRGDVISMSFGEAEECLGPELTAGFHQAFVNATKAGITLFASSGDQGAAQPSCDGSTWIKSTSSPASDPLVTGVGGTELHAAGYCLVSRGCDPTTHPAFGTYLSEIAWNEGPTFGDFQDQFDSTLATGGGFSTVWSAPPYQQSLIKSTKARGVPDVAYNAAVLHGVLTYLDIPGVPAGFYLFGGTSAGSPQWAALTVMMDQAAGHNFGFINGALYKIGQNAADYANAFHDVTSGNNSAMEFDMDNNPVTVIGFNAGAGWDATTGLGTPKAGGVLSELPLFWSAGQGGAAIAGSSSHGKAAPKGPKNMSPH